METAMAAHLNQRPLPGLVLWHNVTKQRALQEPPAKRAKTEANTSAPEFIVLSDSDDDQTRTPPRTTAPKPLPSTPAPRPTALHLRSVPATLPLPSSPVTPSVTATPATPWPPYPQRPADRRLVRDRFPDLVRRPYLDYATRGRLATGTPTSQAAHLGLRAADGCGPVAVHVDFSHAEMAQLSGRPAGGPGHKSKNPLKRLKRLVGDDEAVERLTHTPLAGRTPADVAAFLSDVALQRRIAGAAAVDGRVMTMAVEKAGSKGSRERKRQQEQQGLTTAMTALFWARSANGQHGAGGYCGRRMAVGDVAGALQRLREDQLRLRGAWTSCAGDVATVVWPSPNAFLCGTITHMDQYNRPGNLVLGAVGGPLQAYPDHRIPRSASASASTSAVDPAPWLYTPVVSTDCAPDRGLAFSAGFDYAVRVWRVRPDGSAMEAVAVWRHTAKVNFVVASDGLVATAADVAVGAVRVYRLGAAAGASAAMDDTPFQSFSCSRLVEAPPPPPPMTFYTDEAYETERPSAHKPSSSSSSVPRWAYLPAAVRWGLADAVRHLLLVGFSPRSLAANGSDDDIPDDRRNAGELCLWDADTGRRCRLAGAGTAQNVFEVAWHPSQPIFAAATAPAGNAVEGGVRTQIRLFRVARDLDVSVPSSSSSASSASTPLAATELFVLDCPADDINELALRPNSTTHVWVAAGCTDGCAYVWDTARAGLPLHRLAHGRFLEEHQADRRSDDDTGIKFLAWGAHPDRLYTGSADGLVRVWNVRAPPAHPATLVRDVLACPAAVSFGAFSPDKARLVVGDASGRVFLLDVEGHEGDEDEGFLTEEENEKEKATPTNPRNPKNPKSPKNPSLLRRPPEIRRHATPPPPDRPDAADTADTVDTSSGVALARALVRTGRLRLVADPTVGAVQGPAYADTGLFCTSCHRDGDPQAPLLAACARDQQMNRPRASDAPCVGWPLVELDKLHEWDEFDGIAGRERPLDKAALHRRNCARDLSLDSLTPDTRAALYLADRGSLRLISDVQADYGFAYEEMPDM